MEQNYKENNERVLYAILSYSNTESESEASECILCESEQSGFGTFKYVPISEEATKVARDLAVTPVIFERPHRVCHDCLENYQNNMASSIAVNNGYDVTYLNNDDGVLNKCYFNTKHNLHDGKLVHKRIDILPLAICKSGTKRPNTLLLVPSNRDNSKLSAKRPNTVNTSRVVKEKKPKIIEKTRVVKEKKPKKEKTPKIIEKTRVVKEKKSNKNVQIKKAAKEMVLFNNPSASRPNAVSTSDMIEDRNETENALQTLEGLVDAENEVNETEFGNIIAWNDEELELIHDIIPEIL